jgi:hypothetical protein
METISNRMNEVHKQEIDLIIKKMKDCPKGFECLTINSDALCRVKDRGDSGFVQCVKYWSDCRFRGKLVSEQFICYCPLRCYLHNKFDI